MKITIRFCSLLICIALTHSGYPQSVEKDELPIVAEKWIHIIDKEKGIWAENDSVAIGSIDELLHEGKLIGYYCNVYPEGFMVFSLRKELAPIKAWSETGFFDPNDTHGIASIIKMRMSQIVYAIETRFGPINLVSENQMDDICEVDYYPAWQALLSDISGKFAKKPHATDNYQPGDALLGTNWHQNAPFNNLCPDLNCGETSNGHAWVGCVATAAAQIMNYWSWPPNSYDWNNMMPEVTTASPPEQQAAVAQISSDIGVAVEMDYGCEGSGAWHADMADVFMDNYTYNPSITIKQRSDFTADEWFDLIKFNLDRNRPTQYGVVEHSIVCDGYWETINPAVKTYHMNYGWSGTADDTWYALDALLLGNAEYEKIIHRTCPGPSMGFSLSGWYFSTPSPWKYFDMDVAGSNATFAAGHKIQTLPWIKVFGSGTSSYLTFIGSTGSPTLIFTRGDQSKGIKIQNGAIRFKRNGGFRLR